MPEIADLASAVIQRPSAPQSPRSNDEEQIEVPVLPLEVLQMTLDQLSDVKDFANIAMCSREFRELINTCDDCWKKAFLHDYNTVNAEDYASLPTWRQKYIACTLDITCLKLREKGEIFDELEDTTAALERTMQDLMAVLSKIDKSLGEQKFLLNEKLESVSGHASTHMGSKLGQTILKEAEMVVQGGSGNMGAQSPESPPHAAADQWKHKLTREMCRSLQDSVESVEQWSRQLIDRREAFKSIMNALSLQQASTKRVQESIRMLRNKRASLEAATRYRHTMRRQ